MSAEPLLVEDPNDPEVILRDLPAQERGQFLRQYHDAVDAAHDLAGYRRLQEFLHAWRLTVIATSRPGYYEELAAVRDGTAHATPAEDDFPDWQERPGGSASLYPVTYRVELSGRALGQLGGFPSKAFDALISAMVAVADSPEDLLRTHRAPCHPAVPRRDDGTSQSAAVVRLSSPDHDPQMG
jgi:hypothetical protein